MCLQHFRQFVRINLHTCLNNCAQQTFSAFTLQIPSLIREGGLMAFPFKDLFHLDSGWFLRLNRKDWILDTINIKWNIFHSSNTIQPLFEKNSTRLDPNKSFSTRYSVMWINTAIKANDHSFYAKFLLKKLLLPGDISRMLTHEFPNATPLPLSTHVGLPYSVGGWTQIWVPLHYGQCHAPMATAHGAFWCPCFFGQVHVSSDKMMIIIFW